MHSSLGSLVTWRRIRPHGCAHLKRIEKFNNLEKNETTWMCSPKENQEV